MEDEMGNPNELLAAALLPTVAKVCSLHDRAKAVRAGAEIPTDSDKATFIL